MIGFLPGFIACAFLPAGQHTEAEAGSLSAPTRGLSAAEIVARVAETYASDGGVRMTMTSETEVGGYRAPSVIRLGLEFAGSERMCIRSAPTPEGDEAIICTDGRYVWVRRNPDTKPEQRFAISDREGQENHRAITRYRFLYHQRFAELKPADLLSEKVHRRRLRIGKRTHQCAVIRIRSPVARRAEGGVEDLWVDLESWRVVRSELHERAGSPTIATTIITWTIMEPLATP